MSSNEMCEEHEIAPRLIQDLLVTISQEDVGQDRREGSFFSGYVESFKKQLYKFGPIGDRLGRGWQRDVRELQIFGLPS